MSNDFMDEWIDTAAGGDTWDESTPVEGVYTNQRDNVGPNNSTVYTLRTKDGDVSVWSSTVIKSKFSQIPVGSYVRVESLGKAEGKGGRQYKDYRIQYKLSKVQQVQNTLGGEEVKHDPTDGRFDQLNINDIPF